jgi:cytochrome c biogenesis protein CcmG/thiol:disulfide interchange protein DsbE
VNDDARGINVPAPSRKRWWLRIMVALLPALGFMALLWLGLSRSGSQAVTGERVPQFELPLLDGSGSLSSEELQGSPVVVNFWASWCIPCREEAPLLEHAWHEYRDEGVVFLGVNVNDSKSDARRFVERFGITYPTVRDIDLVLPKQFGVKGLPETFFIDDRWTFVGAISGAEEGGQQGTVVLGAISEDELASNVDVLLQRASSRTKED